MPLRPPALLMHARPCCLTRPDDGPQVTLLMVAVGVDRPVRTPLLIVMLPAKVALKPMQALRMHFWKVTGLPVGIAEGGYMGSMSDAGVDWCGPSGPTC